MEGFTCSRLIPQLDGKLDPRQHSRNGHSTTDALLYMLRTIYEALGSGVASVRIFFTDFTEVFDLIYHSILMQEPQCQSKSSSCVPIVDCGVLDKPEAGSQYRRNFIRLFNTKRRSAPRDQIGCGRLYGDD